MHRLDNGGGKWLRNITNTHSNDLIFGMGNLEAVYLFRDVGEKVIVL